MNLRLKPLSLESTTFVVSDKKNLKPRRRQELSPDPLNSSLHSLKAALRHLCFILQCLDPCLCQFGVWFIPQAQVSLILMSSSRCGEHGVDIQTLENTKPLFPVVSFSVWYHLQRHATVASYDSLKWGFFYLLNCCLNSQNIITYEQQVHTAHPAIPSWDLLPWK